MALETLPFLTVAMSIGASILTVVASDFFGLRRDKERLRMEFAWQLRRQRWDALYGALHSCPRFVSDPQQLIQGISDLIKWSTTEVEPWIGSDRVSPLREKRLSVEAWFNVALASFQHNTSSSIEVPSEQINTFRDCANQELTNALQRMRGKYSQLLDDRTF